MKVHPILWKCKKYLQNNQFFEAHEYLESFWKEEEHFQKKEIHGCIQFFAALELQKRKKLGSKNVFLKSLNKINNPKLIKIFNKIYNKYSLS